MATEGLVGHHERVLQGAVRLRRVRGRESQANQAGDQCGRAEAFDHRHLQLLVLERIPDAFGQASTFLSRDPPGNHEMLMRLFTT
jgi:hypothetical protein